MTPRTVPAAALALSAPARAAAARDLSAPADSGPVMRGRIVAAILFL